MKTRRKNLDAGTQQSIIWQKWPKRSLSHNFVKFGERVQKFFVLQRIWTKTVRRNVSCWQFTKSDALSKGPGFCCVAKSYLSKWQFSVDNKYCKNWKPSQLIYQDTNPLVGRKHFQIFAQIAQMRNVSHCSFFATFRAWVTDGRSSVTKGIILDGIQLCNLHSITNMWVKLGQTSYNACITRNEIMLGLATIAFDWVTTTQTCNCVLPNHTCNEVPPNQSRNCINVRGFSSLRMTQSLPRFLGRFTRTFQSWQQDIAMFSHTFHGHFTCGYSDTCSEENKPVLSIIESWIMGRGQVCTNRRRTHRRAHFFSVTQHGTVIKHHNFDLTFFSSFQT